MSETFGMHKMTCTINTYTHTHTHTYTINYRAPSSRIILERYEMLARETLIIIIRLDVYTPIKSLLSWLCAGWALIHRGGCFERRYWWVTVTLGLIKRDVFYMKICIHIRTALFSLVDDYIAWKTQGNALVTVARLYTRRQTRAEWDRDVAESGSPTFSLMLWPSWRRKQSRCEVKRFAKRWRRVREEGGGREVVRLV